jgi:hypothetical protein
MMKRQAILVLLVLISFLVNGQNTISPYSIFGPGEIQNKGFSSNQAMGGAGISLKTGVGLNSLNPASYVWLDSLHIISEVGAEGKFAGISSNGKNSRGFTGNLKYLALGFRYTNWLAGSIGIMPFSNVGYSITKVNNIAGSNSNYFSNYVGSGGINQFYFSNALKIGKHLSLGVNTSFMFGSLTQVENILPTDIVPQLQITRKDYFRSMYFDYGLQYHFKIKTVEYSLGLIYSYKQNLNSDHSVQVSNSGYSTIQSDEYKSSNIMVPENFGAGLGIKNGEKYTIALDYYYQRWSDVKYPIQYDRFTDLHRFSIGIEFSPWEHRVINTFYKNWDYRFGFSYESSYLNFGKNNIDGKSISFGFGIPFPGHVSKVNITGKIGTNGTTADNLIRERYALIQLGFSLNEIWFIRRKFD